MSSPIRLATSALGNRIYAGRPNKAGDGFKGERFDVTSDALKAISEHVGIGNEVTVHCDGAPAFRVAVIPIASVDTDSKSRDAQQGSVAEGDGGAVPKGDAQP